MQHMSTSALAPTPTLSQTQQPSHPHMHAPMQTENSTARPGLSRLGLQDVSASAQALTSTLSMAQQHVAQLQEASREQKQGLAELDGKAVTPEALQQLASTVQTVSHGLEAARAEAATREPYTLHFECEAGSSSWVAMV